MATLKDAGVATQTLDPNGGDFEFCVTKAPPMLFDNLDVYVNATYPKDYIEHMESFLVTDRIARRMRSGSIVLLSSIYGIVGPDYRMYADTDMEMPHNYAFVKGGVVSVTRALATKYAPKIRVNCVSPGGVYDGQDGIFVNKYVDRVPMKRMAEPEDIAGPVVFLASDAARYITGVNLPVEGGLCAW